MPFAPHRKAYLRNNGRRQQPIAVAAAVAILAVTALVCAGLVAIPLWTALVANWQVDASRFRAA
jgi:hypothetical protein